jgi:hypothetical protein
MSSKQLRFSSLGLIIKDLLGSFRKTRRVCIAIKIYSMIIVSHRYILGQGAAGHHQELWSIVMLANLSVSDYR